MRSRTKKNTKPPKTKRIRSEPKLTIVKSPWSIPDRMRVTLKYVTVAELVPSTTSKDSNFILRPTSIYDVDPLIGGRSVYGYQEWEPFYGRYRVHSSRIAVRFANRENEASDVYVLPINTNPGSNVADPSPYYTHPAARKRLVGSVYGKDSTTVTCRATTLQMGAINDFADDNFSAPFGANPTNDWYWFIGCYKGGTTDYTVGITAYVDVSITVDLYDKKVLQTGLFAKPPSPVRRHVPVSSPSPPPFKL